MNAKNKSFSAKAPVQTIWNWMFLSIFFANMAMNLGQQMSNSLLSLYAKSLNTPADQIGQLMSLFALTALIFRFISGPAMNSFNRKKLLAIAMGFMAFSYLGFSFAPSISGATGIPVIMVLKGVRLVQGVGNAFGNACCLTIVSDVIPKEKFATGMGYYACAQIVSQAIGPSVGIFLRDIFGYSITYIIFAGIMIIAIFLASLVRLTPRVPVKFNLKLSNMIAKEALIPASITLLIAMGFTSINAFLLVYAEEKDIVGGSSFFTVYAITMLATRPWAGRMTDKYGFVKVAIPCVFLTAVSIAMIGFSTNLPMLLLAAFINAFGYGAVQPMLQSLCMKSVPAERRGSASATNYIGMDTATLIGPTLCGEVAKIAGYTSAMWLAMTIPIMASIILIFLTRKGIYNIEERFLQLAAYISKSALL